MIKQFVVIIILLFAFANQRCHFHDNNDFEKYYLKLPVLKVPLIFHSGDLYKDAEERQKKDIEIDNILCRVDSNYSDKYFPSVVFNRVNGRIFEDEEFISIIYRCDADNIWPFLFTFTKSGEKIDSLALNNEIGLDIQGYELSSTIIDYNKSIILIDTAFYYNWDSTGFKSTIDYKIIVNEKFLLKNDGKFYKITANRDSIKIL